MDAIVRRRLEWVRNYESTGDAGITCRRRGISRPTLRLWARRPRLGCTEDPEARINPHSVELSRRFSPIQFSSASPLNSSSHHALAAGHAKLKMLCTIGRPSVHKSLSSHRNVRPRQRKLWIIVGSVHSQGCYVATTPLRPLRHYFLQLIYDRTVDPVMTRPIGGSTLKKFRPRSLPPDL